MLLTVVVFIYVDETFVSCTFVIEICLFWLFETMQVPLGTRSIWQSQVRIQSHIFIRWFFSMMYIVQANCAVCMLLHCLVFHSCVRSDVLGFVCYSWNKQHSLTHCCAWPAEGRSVLHIERSWPAIQAGPTYRPTSSSTCCSQFLRGISSNST